MPRLGAHMSIAGGLPRAIDRARLHACQALQIFTKSANQWRARPILPGEIDEFRRRAEVSGIHPIVAHASYLINLAASDRPLRERSRRAFGEEVDRAETLGLLGLVIHPGAYTRGSEPEGIRLIAEAVAQVLDARPDGRTLVLLEGTAGQGTSIGHRFEHLAEIIERLGGSRRLGVCLDTCHLLAAGYDITTPAGCRETFDLFDRVVGLSRLKVVHVNDSMRPCGSRVDRHEHIGQGCLGLEPFRWIMNDPRLRHLPMILETPKTRGRWGGRLEADPLDVMNLDRLRALLTPGA